MVRGEKTARKLPTQEYLNRIFEYIPETGNIYWRVKKARRVEIGDKVGSISGWGYAQLAVDNIRYRAHRIIWKMVYGKDPDFIDHINGDKLDNRIVNLRSVTKQENAKNSSISKANTSGVTGVYWLKRGKRWWAQIKLDGKAVYLGSFENKNDAIKARKEAEKKYGYHENHGREK